MSTTEIARFITAIQNDAGQNIGFEIRPERPDGNGGYITCAPRGGAKDDLLAVLTEGEAEFALAGAAANARADAAEQNVATLTATLAERDGELNQLRADIAALREAETAAQQRIAFQEELIQSQEEKLVELKATIAGLESTAGESTGEAR